MKTNEKVFLTALLVALCAVTLYYQYLKLRLPMLSEGYVPRTATLVKVPTQKPVSPPTLLPRALRPTPAAIEPPVNITGPLKGRRILYLVLPTYPDWAEEQGLSGSVSIKIWVHPDGHVSSFSQMVRSTTVAKLDEIAKKALQKWEFEAIPNATGKQWGIVTLRYTLLTTPPPMELLEKSLRPFRPIPFPTPLP